MERVCETHSRVSRGWRGSVWFLLLSVGGLRYQQHARVSRGWRGSVLLLLSVGGLTYQQHTRVSRGWRGSVKHTAEYLGDGEGL